MGKYGNYKFKLLSLYLHRYCRILCVAYTLSLDLAVAPKSFLCIFQLSVWNCIHFIKQHHCFYNRQGHTKRKRPLLVATITACLAILIILKYLVKLNFFAAHTLSLFGTTQTIRSIVETYLFPIGISYYTLQLISYLLDVYWGRQKAESNYLKVLLFTCYFPQMVQGPISKYSELAPELFRSHTFSWRNIKNGSQLIQKNAGGR